MTISRFAVLVGTLALGTGCSFGESGVGPPIDRVFLPSGLAIEPDGHWMYVVNSNSDLRFNAGTVVAVDLTKVTADRARTDWPACVTPSFVRSSKETGRFCCHDYFDDSILNCDDREYIDAKATVEIGSFGNTVILHRPADLTRPARLFVSVRAEPSVTFIETTVTSDGVRLSCQNGKASGGSSFCDESHKIRGAAKVEDGPQLTEEPRSLVIDDTLKTLYVGSTLEGISVIDLCPDVPVLASVTERVFSPAVEGVTSITVTEPGNPAAPIYLTGRSLLSNSAGKIESVFIRGADTCDEMERPKRPNLALVPGPSFVSSAFFPNGVDLRGVVFTQEGKRAYALHRNGSTRENPAAVVQIDRTPDPMTGLPIDRAIASVEVCGGATEMQLKDNGRGARLFVVCFDSGQVYVVDPDLMYIPAVINAGRGPNTLRFDPNDPTLAYLSGFGDNDVSVIDLRPGSPTEYQVVQRIGFPQLKATESR